MKIKPANGTRGQIIKSFDGEYYFRVYSSDHNFEDYALAHSDLTVVIDDLDASFYDDEFNARLDHAPQTLGLNDEISSKTAQEDRETTMESDFSEFDKAYLKAMLPENPDQFDLLAAQANFGIYRHDLWRGTGRRFAESIVKECANIALREDHDPYECILKHFGVK